MTGTVEMSDLLAGEGDPGVVAAWAAEALRAVNRLTLAFPAEGVPGWEGVGDIYPLLGELRLLAERMPQALGQIARHLEQPGVHVRYRSDANTTDSLETLIVAAVAALESAQRGAHDVARCAAAAQNSVSHIGTG